MSSSLPAPPDLNELIELFFDDPNQLGVLERVEPRQMPQAYRRLLDHNSHMTVTVEAAHGSPVDVQVLQTRLDDQRYYSRKILLRRHDTGQVVQFGIARLDRQCLAPEVWAEIQSQKTPLGRVLIRHDVMRDVQLAALWKVQPGPELGMYFGCPPSQFTYGRTAMIYCAGEPAIELLEIVIPV